MPFIPYNPSFGFARDDFTPIQRIYHFSVAFGKVKHYCKQIQTMP